MLFLWLQQNWGNVLVVAALVVLVTVLAWYLIASKRKKKGGCCGGCAGCALQQKCGRTEHSDNEHAK